MTLNKMKFRIEVTLKWLSWIIMQKLSWKSCVKSWQVFFSTLLHFGSRYCPVLYKYQNNSGFFCWRFWRYGYFLIPCSLSFWTFFSYLFDDLQFERVSSEGLVLNEHYYLTTLRDSKWSWSITSSGFLFSKFLDYR